MYVDEIIKVEKVDLSVFVRSYKDNVFQKVELINDKLLKGYHFL
jgi:hypothetical protein